MTPTAAILYAANEPFRIESVRLDPPKREEVLVAMVAAGICQSDHHFQTGYRRLRMPALLGHEGAGIVEAVGEGVTHVQPGDHVIFSFIASCGRCRPCTLGRAIDCVRGVADPEGVLLDGTHRMRTHDGQGIAQLARLGGFSTSVVIPEDACIVVDDRVDLHAAPLLSCAALTGLGAALNQARIQTGDSVAVIGVGGVGLFAVQGAAIGGAGMVVAVDLNADKLQAARRLGATEVIDASLLDPLEALREHTHGDGVDKAILAIDHVAPEHLELLVDAIRPGGIAVVVGVSDLAATHIPVSPAHLVSSHKTLVGTLSGGSNPKADVLRYLDLYDAGRLKLDELVSRRYPLSDINQGFEDLVAGRNLRGIVDMAS